METHTSVITRNTTFGVEYQRIAIESTVQNERPRFVVPLKKEYTFDLYDQSSLSDISLGQIADPEGDLFTTTS